jgi:hypothetical protein
MTDETLSRIERLEARLQDEPDSQALREELLLAFARAGLMNDPRRVRHVAEFVQRFPRAAMARSPLTHVDSEDCPEGFAMVEREWLRHQREHPADLVIAHGVALFIAESHPDRAWDILRNAQRTNPGDSKLCVDAARCCPDARESLALFKHARSLGADHPNLMHWMAEAALDAGELGEAEQVGHELLSLAADLRSAHGERLDWTERAEALWTRASTECKTREEATALVQAIMDHAFWKHWGHTTLGVVMAHRGNMPAAGEHLRRSAQVAGEPRLSSYGPSFRLANQLARHGEWDAIGDYLRAVTTFWSSGEIERWLSQVEQRQQPDLPDD